MVYDTSSFNYTAFEKQDNKNFSAGFYLIFGVRSVYYPLGKCVCHELTNVLSGRMPYAIHKIGGPNELFL